MNSTFDHIPPHFNNKGIEKPRGIDYEYRTPDKLHTTSLVLPAQWGSGSITVPPVGKFGLLEPRDEVLIGTTVAKEGTVKEKAKSVSRKQLLLERKAAFLADCERTREAVESRSNAFQVTLSNNTPSDLQNFRGDDWKLAPDHTSQTQILKERMLSARRRAGLIAEVEERGDPGPSSGVHDRTALLSLRRDEALLAAQRSKGPPKSVWAGEGAARDPLAHMRASTADPSLTSTMSRTQLFANRQAQSLMAAKKFRPRKNPGIHKGEPSDFATASDSYWWTNEGKDKARPVPEHLRTIANRELSNDAFKNREISLAELHDLRRARSEVAEKVTRVARNWDRGQAKSKRFTQMRWTDMIIEFSKAPSSAVAAETLDETGKSKHFAPKELDTLYSSFTKHGKARPPPIEATIVEGSQDRDRSSATPVMPELSSMAGPAKSRRSRRPGTAAVYHTQVLGRDASEIGPPRSAPSRGHSSAGGRPVTPLGFVPLRSIRAPSSPLRLLHPVAGLVPDGSVGVDRGVRTGGFQELSTSESM